MIPSEEDTHVKLFVSTSQVPGTFSINVISSDEIASYIILCNSAVWSSMNVRQFGTLLWFLPKIVSCPRWISL